MDKQFTKFSGRPGTCSTSFARRSLSTRSYASYATNIAGRLSPQIWSLYVKRTDDGPKLASLCGSSLAGGEWGCSKCNRFCRRSNQKTLSKSVSNLQINFFIGSHDTEALSFSSTNGNSLAARQTRWCHDEDVSANNERWSPAVRTTLPLAICPCLHICFAASAQLASQHTHNMGCRRNTSRKK